MNLSTNVLPFLQEMVLEISENRRCNYPGHDYAGKCEEHKMDKKESGQEPPPHLKKDINNYCDFLLQQEQTKQHEIAKFVASKNSSSSNPEPKDKTK